MDFLETLNDKQRQAVTAPKEPMLVLAGPGTGKTRTLVARILYLIHHYEIPPHKILAVTFTNKAKEEMRLRLREKLGDAASDLMIGTFHHYCLDVLRTHHHEAGLPQKFTIADEAAQLITLSRISRIADERSLRTVLSAISAYRLNKDNLNPTFQGTATKWLKPYQQELCKNKFIDFDQIILLTRKLFVNHPELIDIQQQRFDAILVDEFQDTDPIQYDIMRTLAQKHRNIFVVADDDQSIFAWRGAQIENINRYISDFGCKERMTVLNENYRSAQCIINIATNLLRGHHFREKEIHAIPFPKIEYLEPDVQFLAFDDDDDEIQFVSGQIQTLTASDDKNESHPLRYADIAILYPTHAIGEKLEAKLLSSRIPCQLVKRQGVFDQQDVRKIVLLLKLLQNSEDDVSLEQFFEMELNNDVIFEQIKPFKSKNRTFKQTLYHVMRYATLSGMSRGQFCRTVTACFGLISNLISYLENNSGAKLEDLINTICNLTQADHSLTIHGKVRELRDPFEIPGILKAIEKIRATIKHDGKIYITGSNPDLTNICHSLLSHGADPHSPLEDPVEGLSKEAQGGGIRQLPSAFCLLPSDHSLLPPGADLFLCLDPASVEALLHSYPDIPETQIIIIAPVLSDDQHNCKEERSAPADSQQHSASSIISPFSTAVTVFKLLQALTSANGQKPFRKYVAFDLETTSRDTRTTGIVEIGAIKVRNGEIIDRFGTLVNPEQPITRGAYKVHGISDEEVRDKKTFKELLPEFLKFIGDDMLVAHNGFGFDFPILLRLYREATGKMLPNRRFDTLPLARRLFSGQPASVDALMQRFSIQDTGGRHRALDDTIYLAPIFERLQDVELSHNRRTEHENLLELVTLALYLESESADSLCPGSEEHILFQLGARKLLSRFSQLPEQFQPIFAEHKDDIQKLFERLAAAETDEDIQAPQVFSGREVSIARLKELAQAFPADNLREIIRQFLDHATLYTTQDDILDVNAVNLFTIHSAKGLEFPVVFVSGVEKGNLPSFYSVREEIDYLREKKLDEQRRLFYVAMTRARRKLFVTYVNKRGQYPKKRSQFLIELGVESEEAAHEPDNA